MSDFLWASEAPTAQWIREVDPYARWSNAEELQPGNNMSVILVLSRPIITTEEYNQYVVCQDKTGREIPITFMGFPLLPQLSRNSVLELTGATATKNMLFEQMFGHTLLLELRSSGTVTIIEGSPITAHARPSPVTSIEDLNNTSNGVLGPIFIKTVGSPSLNMFNKTVSIVTIEDVRGNNSSIEVKPHLAELFIPLAKTNKKIILYGLNAKKFSKKLFLNTNFSSYFEFDENTTVKQGEGPSYQTMKLSDITKADVGAFVELFGMIMTRPHRNMVSVTDGSKSKDTRTLMMDVLTSSIITNVGKYVRVIGRLKIEGGRLTLVDAYIYAEEQGVVSSINSTDFPNLAFVYV
ncbi:hypothetical protein PENTCL1PPCAC_21015 [Pristionchus entomophagus]|uniref:Uncharacterized protein n=1 Tax=Pristionchus entomophagus TaxID=358040 RepID=A0AAV5TWB1_9BILA|nr:hypothetical protein PENTCL1PPCAC_21015 [Pristionchus entomophagus]